ncbi:MAG: Eco57I restriction-modification methylase domain-containing protein [Planctomycetia bacterium]|nr:Eco57I restriction-modification methylase domain-containing protein [Candidatus Brocadia sp.]QOJ07262.1 MAG: Eco57I restriction-modification methylase domain-containing protein [Planctomycetia bacterium]TVL97121.1 MAG: hypothetical protein CV082_04970 [Candidatus Brocadia sp. BL1]HQU32038.1 Eco57I restriction-modification methylase domain-containing protein [Candidatus Brocadia sapporoensis]
MAETISKTRFKQLINAFQLKELFNELGWDNVRKKEQVVVENKSYTLDAVAEKKGFVVFACSPENNGRIPDYHIRKKIDGVITKLYFEHLIIFCDQPQGHLCWQLAVREQGKPTALRETNYYAHQEPELLFQKLKGLFFSIDDEEKISIVDVKYRMQEQFNVNAEKVTKQFYDRFKKEHTSFLNFIKGISENVDKDWYASLMLNRLMFIYFIQKKGFLDNDKDYLRNRLKATQEKRGKDKFYSFYRNFLLILFHKGLGSCERTPEITNEIGTVPYLNGGLFDVHHIEHKYKDTEITDEAFEQVFSFFDQYEWHLDTRITATGKDINPDVIGYIFEKYINDRASMGAYYTKEDITDYISKNCIIPYLFDEVKRSYPKAFNPDTEIWKLLQAESDKYMYDAVKHGTQHALPPEIEAGINQVSARTAWNKPAPPEYALPTEIWREVVERRKRYAEIKTKVEDGAIHEINDFITYNLNIRQFAQDVIENSYDPEFIRHFYKALLNISILDPTCGSGAFLFAAINILEPLYEACIQRMENFVADAKNSPSESGQRGMSKYKFFEETLAIVKSPEHPNLQYFIFKNIILRNIYGVDIMHEAVEIAKLRLFLKLVATVDVDYKKPNLGLEPLPDIDFNIRAGNTLVGFATLDQIKDVLTKERHGKAIQKKLLSTEDIDTLKRIDESAEMASRAFQRFQEMQTDYDMNAHEFTNTKSLLNERLKVLEKELNSYLAREYSIDVNKNTNYQKWLTSYNPFHWFIEFYGIMNKGGFDVIIGNPPYVEYIKVKKDYTVHGYETENCGNLYAFIIERNLALLHNTCRTGMIVPHSSICTDRMESLQHLFTNEPHKMWISTYCIRPAKLFVGVDQRLAIYVLQRKTQIPIIFSSCYHRWNEEFRPHLFPLIEYVDVSIMQFQNSLPKAQSILEDHIWNKLKRFNTVGTSSSNYGKYSVYFHNAPRYWIRAMDFAPYFWNERDGEQISTQVKELHLQTKIDASVVVAILNSSLFYWWFIILSDCRHLNLREIENFPIGLDKMSDSIKQQLSNLSKILMDDLKQHKQRKECQYKATGKVVYDEFYPKYSKPIIDEIDKVLAQHYDFTDEELDFIINYDIKYRMGKELDAED